MGSFPNTHPGEGSGWDGGACWGGGGAQCLKIRGHFVLGIYDFLNKVVLALKSFFTFKYTS